MQFQQALNDMDSDDDDDDDYDSSEEDDDEEDTLISPLQRREARMAERLSVRLLAVPDDDEAEQERILRKSLQVAVQAAEQDGLSRRAPSMRFTTALTLDEDEKLLLPKEEEEDQQKARYQIWTMITSALMGLLLVVVALWVGIRVVGPPLQPTGPYQLVERQEGDEFFDYYNFYEGPDSVGSNGYNMYVSQEKADALGIVNVTMETDELDIYNVPTRRLSNKTNKQEEPFIYLATAPTKAGPRDSIRLQGIRRFNRGLFVIDVRHMPAGCGVWPAFWLTDEANWPVNGEIDIVEGVNYQSVAKTALHATKGCSMFDIPLGVMKGEWDTAQGIPDKDTGIPDMTLRYARNCFVYDPQQWLNQGCVAVDKDGGTLGGPLNKKGGGVFALEWDPMNKHIRTWVFTPHTAVPDNLVDAIRTASLPDEDRVAPDTSEWPVPYGYFAIGDVTDCPASHFRHMRIVFNTAFCGSVAGNRFQMDCKEQSKKFDTCNAWVKSEPEELDEAYWKIRGVYVYEREWERRLSA